MSKDRAYEKGRSGKINVNPYDENSPAFDNFERGRKQWLKSSAVDNWHYRGFDDYDDFDEDIAAAIDKRNSTPLAKDNRVQKVKNSYTKAKGK
jgi:hypothetical protein